MDSKTRLGGVEVVCEAHEGVLLRDAHKPTNQLRIYESDVPQLVEFLCHHYAQARRLIERERDGPA